MKLTKERIEQLASKPGVRAIAARNFLSSLGNSSAIAASMNLAADTIAYRWSAETVAAIKQGIDEHFGAHNAGVTELRTLLTARDSATKRPAWWPKRLQAYEWRELENEYGGLCHACGELAYGDCEPDARRYPCGDCGKKAVYGAEESRMMGAIVVTGEDE